MADCAQTTPPVQKRERAERERERERKRERDRERERERERWRAEEGRERECNNNRGKNGILGNIQKQGVNGWHQILLYTNLRKKTFVNKLSNELL
jgi:hypothetical protein